MEGVETSGESIGRYRLIEKIGEGGMGVVHLATDPFGRKVAVKVLRPGVASDQTALRRLAREVDSMRRVHSPHVAEIVDADVTAEPPYVVTQFVPGRTLEQAVRDDGPLRGDALQRLATGLASALAAIHDAGIVHRDLKPGNVMFLENGEPVVIDFGIAQGVDATRLTATGLVIGTPGYLAPEIIEGEDAGAPADVHAWAGTIAYAATGRAPFGGGTFESIFYKIMEGRPDLDGVPEALLPVVRAAMARNPAERPTAHALVELTRRIDVNSTRLDPPSSQTKRLTAVSSPPPSPPAPARPRDFVGQLPPAPPPPPPQQYARSPYGAPGPQQGSPGYVPRPPKPPRPDEPKPYGVYRFLSLLLLVAAIGLSLVTPTLALVVVLAVLLVLRTADRGHKELTSKRTRRGPRSGDLVAVIAKSPFTAVRAALGMLLVSPLAIMAGVIVLLIGLAAKTALTIPHAVALGTAAFVIVQCLGPGSEPPRRQLARFWGAALPRRNQALIALAVIGFVVFLLVSFALSQTPDLRPFATGSSMRDLAHLRSGIRSLLGG
ncbi:serine/threonine-protein kinase [Actinoallomurus rhizosphaericola]|uniref:serine/threonine-protein kinase n=1 Tax=Actinoallomurus rhizosphaericola TaxID=2952536 RepID=UPI0020914BF3|nr:serine/threonine-protein kinase [Actinoallomurus rhizosphaericola]MCO5991950.1 serine/threonine protein kinase [Actinoallomurus rhizosphaericola]